MTITREDIHAYFKEAKKRKASHLMMVSDDFSHEYYPVYVKKGELESKQDHYSKSSMQRIVEILDTSKPFDKQGR